MADGLLDQPFDFSQAFDRALKNIVKTLGNRPAFETADETVGPGKILPQEYGD